MEARFRLDHLGVAVPDLDAAVSRWADLFGCSLLAGPFDDVAQEARVAFLSFGSSARAPGPEAPRLELVAPLHAGSHVSRVLARGLGAYHVCYEVRDLDATVAQLRGKGCLVVREPVPAVAHDGRRIAWLYTPARALVELLEGPGVEG